MSIYWLGLSQENTVVKKCFLEWSPMVIKDHSQFRDKLMQKKGETSHFFLEIEEVNEKKYLELQAVVRLYESKVRFIVFYKKLIPSPVINKLHGSEVLLIGPEERVNSEILVRRFLNPSTAFFRRWDRIILKTRGQILSEGGVFMRQARVLNFSPHGVCIEASDVDIKKKDFICFEYQSQDLKVIRMQTRVAWVRESINGKVIGLQFIAREV